jgi:hypothetical protein
MKQKHWNELTDKERAKYNEAAKETIWTGPGLHRTAQEQEARQKESELRQKTTFR